MQLSHEQVLIHRKYARYAYVSSTTPKRLIVFIHGFLGKTLISWGDMPDVPEDDKFWEESDLLFIGYRTIRSKSGIQSLASHILSEIRDFYPQQNSSLYAPNGFKLRDANGEEYEEIYIVGHSMGGVIIKDMILQDIDYSNVESRNRSVFKDANIRLFSPAHGGFRPGGKLRVLALAHILEPCVLKFSDLNRRSPYLDELRRRYSEQSSKIIPKPKELQHLTIWARPENIVNTITADNDIFVGEVHGKNHITICKPSENYWTPWSFIKGDGENGYS